MSSESRPVGEDELHAYVDNQLDAWRRVEVERYLAAHPAVAQRVNADLQQRALLREAFMRDDDEPLAARLNLASLIEQRMVQRRFPWRAAAAVLLAVSLGAAAGAAGGMWFAGRPIGPFMTLAADTAASYAVYSADKRRPVELWAAQREDLNRWVSNRLNRPVAAPDLAAFDYQFLGGRLVPTARGPGALFMYENHQGGRLVLLVRRMALSRTTQIEQVDIGGMPGCAWSEGEMGYGMVGEEPYGRLLEVSGKVRSQLRG